MCKYCQEPIYIKSKTGEYLELPNNVCPMCGEKVEFGLKERTDIAQKNARVCLTHG